GRVLPGSACGMRARRLSFDLAGKQDSRETSARLNGLERQQRQRRSWLPSDSAQSVMRDLAGGPGFEPGLLGSEPRVLPLNYPPSGPAADCVGPYSETVPPRRGGAELSRRARLWQPVSRGVSMS